MTTQAVDHPDDRPVVAHVNYLFFHSTQSFISFYLSSLTRVRSICLTRTPESPAVDRRFPEGLASDFYLFGDQRESSLLSRLVWRSGLTVHRGLTRMPAWIAEPSLALLHGRIAPALRSDADPAGFLAWAENILRERKVELIHAYFGPVAWRMLSLSKRLRVPLVVTFLGDEVAPRLGDWWSWWIQSDGKPPDWPARLQELFEGADLLLAEGPFLRRRLVELGSPAHKTLVQRIALPIDRYATADALPPSRDKKTILFAGRFCAQKGVLYVLAAVRELLKERNDVELRMIGDEKLTDGKYASQVYGYIREHDLDGHVRLLGFLNHADYLRELEAADIFLHPSIVDDDGLSEGGAPTTILEAQALGKPVVSTRHCDIPNVTLPDESAILVAERDSAALADALRSLLDDPERRRAMGRAGRRHMQANHDVAKEAALLEERDLSHLAGTGPR